LGATQRGEKGLGDRGIKIEDREGTPVNENINAVVRGLELNRLRSEAEPAHAHRQQCQWE